FDHVLRPLAFCVTVAHWFNPLVWVAYWLLGVDMEQSCDEAVLRRFGADIRKAYSTSLVGLAAAPRALRMGPLGFAENDITRRVKHILRWKRPHIALTALAVCVLAVAGCQLLTDPIESSSAEPPETAYEDRVADYAFRYMTGVESRLEEYIEIVHRGYSIQEHAVFEDLLNEPVTVYQLDVFYVPADYETAREALSKTAIEAEFVKNGDQYEIRGIPMVSRIYFTPLRGLTTFEINDLQYDGTDAAYLETLLRAEFEEWGWIFPPTYDSKHYVVTYEEYHPGVMRKLLLSQPAKQGDGGIWFVERMIDENGNEHISAPQNYTALQTECDNGHNPWMLDPEQVALAYIRQTYDSARIVEIKEGTYEDFQAWPVSTYTGYIIGIDLEANHLKLMPTVEDENGAPALWAKGYPEYYDYLPFYETTEWGLDGNASSAEEVREAIKAVPSGADLSENVFVKCTYSGGYITAVKAFTEYWY
ncbi:MAG: hypothetical protein IJ042_08405, partial [Butyricicoccus sp.]|nr:hypothetical protein [Butyricicoccus sp.]